MGLGDMLKKLFGAADGSTSKEETLGDPIEYKGYQIYLKARPVDGQFGVGGLIRKEIDGEIREHQFLRADQLPSREMCDEITLQKARQTIDQLGDDIFGRP